MPVAGGVHVATAVDGTPGRAVTGTSCTRPPSATRTTVSDADAVRSAATSRIGRPATPTSGTVKIPGAEASPTSVGQRIATGSGAGGSG